MRPLLLVELLLELYEKEEEVVKLEVELVGMFVVTVG